jgi:hypothetical protein
VSKLSDVETVETVEGAEATRNCYEELEAVALISKSGFEFREGANNNSRVSFIPGCRDPRVT